MCMLTFFASGVTTDGDGIWNGAMTNQDGHGWAIVVPGTKHAAGRIIVGHGMRADNVIDDFLAARDKYSDGPALFHSRWATHGVVDTGNCHPFLVGGDPRVVLAHNGILPAKAHPRKGDNRSDTRKFAESILPKWGSLDSRSNRGRIASWLGSNKVVVLSVHPRSKKDAYVFGEALGNTDAREGVWYSNYDWEGWKSKPTVPTYLWGLGTAYDGLNGAAVIGGKMVTRWDDESTNRAKDCRDCGAYGSMVSHLNMCSICRSCADCGGWVNLDGKANALDGDCNCYFPAGTLEAVARGELSG